LFKDSIRPADTLEVPEVFQGLVSGLATHQTLLGDAIATEDPDILFKALYSYPVMQDTAESRTMFRELFEINKEELSDSLYQAKNKF
jgi:alpha-galactosidase/6-phospho-beta-glucosidase family protein